MQVKSYKDLIVWQKSMDLVEMVYQVTKSFPREELFLRCRKTVFLEVYTIRSRDPKLSSLSQSTQQSQLIKLLPK